MYVSRANQSMRNFPKISRPAGCFSWTPCLVGSTAHAATGGSAIQAMRVLVDHGVQPDRILFLNMIASPEGLQAVYKAFPEVRVISAWVDVQLSDQSYSRSRH